MTVLVLQVLSVSVVIAGVWLSDFALPTKMIIIGGGASAWVFVQYQLVTFFELHAKGMAKLYLVVRVLESSQELGRLQPSNTDSARELVLREMNDENARSAFQEEISPSSSVDFIATLIFIALAVVIAWAWVALFRPQFY